MKNIKNAIEIEKQYLEKKLKGEPTFNLIDEVKKCGFNTLDEYFKDKREYEFNLQQFKLKEITQAEIVPEVMRVLTAGETGVWFVDSDRTAVFNGFKGDIIFNKDYCLNNNIPTYSILTNAGTIVHQSGDFSLGVCCPKQMMIDSQFILKGIQQILKKYTKKYVAINGNDILIDNKKVCGSASYTKNGVFLFLSYFSFNNKSTLITKITNIANPEKVPGYIDFMSRDMFKEEVKKWLLEHGI